MMVFSGIADWAAHPSADFALASGGVVGSCLSGGVGGLAAGERGNPPHARFAAMWAVLRERSRSRSTAAATHPHTTALRETSERRLTSDN